MSQRLSSIGFRFQLDLHSGVPAYRQIIDQVRGGIASGLLTAGHQLPTVRALAVDLAINPNTVVRAYRELEFGGLLETQQGTGTFISELIEEFRGLPSEPARGR
jgi:GntR family transcriptional regulator